MDYLPGILAAYGAFLLGVMSPGPNVLAIIGISLSQPRRHSVLVALGIGSGTFIWSSLTVLGLSALIAAYAEVSLLLRLIGGTYLLYLGLKSLRSAAQKKDIAVRALAADMSPWRCYGRGLAIQMSNPKAALFWLSLMSLVLAPNAPAWVAIAIVAGTTALSLSWHVLLALVFSTAGVSGLYHRARRVIEGLLGGVFCLLGGRLLLANS